MRIKLFLILLIVSVFPIACDRESGKDKSASSQKEQCQSKGEYMKTELIPRSVLFGNPEKAAAQISKDGKYISYLAPLNGVLNIYVADIDSPELARPITNDTNRGIRQYFWLYDNDHILYMQDDKGDENWHIHSVNIKTKESKDVTPFKGARAEIEGVSWKFPTEIIVGLNKRDPKYFDLYKLDITKGKLDLFYENKQDFGNIIIDNNYKLRFATKQTKEGGDEIYQFNNDLTTKLFLSISPEDLYTTGILGFDKSGEVLYFGDSRGRDTSALTTWDLKTNDKQILYKNDKVDFDNLLVHPTEKNIQAVSATYKKSEWTVLDDKVKDDMQYLKSLNDGEFSIISKTLDDSKWLVAYINDDKPISYYLYNRETKKAKFLFTNKPDLEKYKLAQMNPVVIKTRDGLDMVSYITLPAGSAKDKDDIIPDQPLPLILNVHGGPTVRDTWGFSPEDQWLANRGYAVLDVNYRGSAGFGKKFISLGDGEWGGKMHDDLIDAVNWAIEQKITTKDKVAIYGGSYGGYAALVGLTFTPDVFACGVDIVGISNLITNINSKPAYWAHYLNRYVIKIGGDPSTEEGRKFLQSRSPLTFADKITKPLLIAQGANDPRVKQAESDQIVAAMKKKGIPVTYLLYPDEGHGFARPENRMSFYAVTEQFLSRCLGGKVEPVGDAFNGSTIEIKEGAKVNSW
jgi:dipeptidyl aminopeptidase/acylaminoacyl peptidase